MNDMDQLKMLRFYVLLISFIGLNVVGLNAQSLFQEDVQDWFKEGDADWKFHGNELVGNINDGAGFVMTRQPYKDFVLEMEFKPDSTINSGVFIRCKNFNISATDCYEVNIWDLHPNQDYRTGAIVTKSLPLAKVETNGKWNTYKIKAKNDHIQVWINGILTAKLKDNVLPEGYVGLQAMGTGEIRFRNIQIKPLKTD